MLRHTCDETNSLFFCFFHEKIFFGKMMKKKILLKKRWMTNTHKNEYMVDQLTTCFNLFSNF